jgi:hypothetical protein
MSRLGRVAALAAMLLAAVAAPAGAHAGNPNYRSVLDSLTPNVPGLQVQVLGYDNQLELTNRTGRTVEIEGYENEPYARLLPDGTVQVNERSPALYLNEDRFGTTRVPATAKPSLPPVWHTQDKTGRFVWHDHRMHWMSPNRPPKVIDTSRKTKIFDYTIPVKDGAQSAAISGTLFWVGSPSSFPVAAVVSLVVIALLAIAAVVVVRRRRRGGGGFIDGVVGGAGGQPGAAEAGDATAPTPSSKEAW